jgi:hypothetical protein
MDEKKKGQLKETGQEVPQEVRSFFNPESRITAISETNGYLVETILVDGRYVAGGQKLSIILSPEVEIFTGFDDVGIVSLDSYLSGYSVLSMRVEDMEYLGENEQFYFAAGDEFSSTNEMFANLGRAFIIAPQLANGDQLAMVTHEQGHCMLNNFNYRQLSEDTSLLDRLYKQRHGHKKIKNRGFFSTFSEVPNVEAKESSETEGKLLVNLLNVEQLADIEAIKKIQNDRLRGLDLFPKDPSLEGVRAIFREAISSRLVRYPDVALTLGKEIERFFVF